MIKDVLYTKWNYEILCIVQNYQDLRYFHPADTKTPPGARKKKIKGPQSKANLVYPGARFGTHLLFIRLFINS